MPAAHSLTALERAARSCRGCPLFAGTTQTVFGREPTTAALILVGEQPGDVEDKRGRPLVGPAGAVLWQCVEDADHPSAVLRADDRADAVRAALVEDLRVANRVAHGE